MNLQILIKKVLLISIFFLFSSIRVFASTPDQISDLTLWLDASQGVTIDGSVAAIDGDAVQQWDDNSVLSNNAIQTTLNKKPIYKTNILNGNPVLRFSGAQNLVTSSFLSSAYNTQMTYFSVTKKSSTSLKVISSNQGTTWYTGLSQAFISTTGGLSPNQFLTSPLGTGSTMDTSVEYFRYNGSEATQGINGNNSSSTKTGNLNLSGTLTVGSLSSNSFYFDGDIAELIVYNRALTDLEVQEVEEYLMTKYAITELSVPTSIPLIVFEGDSITSGVGSSGDQNYPAQVESQLGISATYQNVGVPSDIVSSMITDAITRIDPQYSDERDENIVVLFGGTNDLAVGLVGATTTYDRIVAYSQARRDAGFKTIVVTMMPRSSVGTPVTFEDDRQQINAWIRENWQSFADGIADPALDSDIGDAGDETNTTYYVDKVHMSNTGYGILAGYVTASIKQILDPLSITDLDFSSGSDSVSVTFTTNQLGSTKIYYGLDTNYASSTAESDISTRVQNHSDIISNLVSCSIYHTVAVSTDLNGNNATSTDSIFTTKGCVGLSDIEAYNTQFIEKDSGGNLELLENEKGITLDIPVNFSSGDANFQIKRLNKIDLQESIGYPLNRNLIGQHIYDLKALSDESSTVTNFDNDIIINFVYSDSDISEINESSISAYTWNGSSWSEIAGCVLDTNSNTISCPTSHFSVFGLFGTGVSSVVSRTSGGVRYGCKDEQAINYNFFSRHKQELCEYSTPSIVVSNTIKFTKNLEFGSVDDEVKSLQKILNSLGFTVAVSGPGSIGNETNVFGPATKAALIKYQISKAITPAVGYFGPLTRVSIDTAVTSIQQIPSAYVTPLIIDSSTKKQFTRDLEEGNISEEVRLLQKILNSLGFTVAVSGPGSIGNETNVFGPATKAALIKYQISKAITPAVGYFGVITRSVIE